MKPSPTDILYKGHASSICILLLPRQNCYPVLLSPTSLLCLLHLFFLVNSHFPQWSLACGMCQPFHGLPNIFILIVLSLLSKHKAGEKGREAFQCSFSPQHFLLGSLMCLGWFLLYPEAPEASLQSPARVRLPGCCWFSKFCGYFLIDWLLDFTEIKIQTWLRVKAI